MDFAVIPRYVEHLLIGGDGPVPPGLPERAERVVVVLLDAFGAVFLERFGDHPALRDAVVSPLSSQFPSTTAAHVTTMHTGMPVGTHGVYEWNVYEPSLGRVITPLRFSFAGDAEADTLRAAGVDPRDLVPADPCLYERLAAGGVVSLVYQPDAFSPSTFDGAVVRGADIRPFRDLREALADAVRSVRALERGYAYVYFHAIDLVGHVCGPSSPEFADAVRAALDALLVAQAQDDVLVLLTADHGQVDVDPARTLWLDELHPPLRRLPLRPAGSARDVFLHVPEEDVAATVEALSEHCEAVPVADLLASGAFGDAGSRLRARLGSVCVLPPPGRMAWLREYADVATGFRGHHGGRSPEESRTYLARLA
jgi:hypothetical protein